MLKKLMVALVVFLIMGEIKAQNWWLQGLVSHYAFDSLSGVDSALNGINLSTGTLAAINNRFNIPQKAISFTQTVDGASAVASHLPNGSSVRSFSVWIRLNQLPSGNIPFESPFFYGEMQENQGQGLVVDGLGILSYAGYKSTTNSSADLEATTALNVGEWTHIGCSYDGDTAKIYLNGQLNNSDLKTWNTTANRMLHFGRMGVTGGGQTGGSSISLPYSGDVDDFRAYNRELSAEEFFKLSKDDFSPLSSGLNVSERSALRTEVYPNPVSNLLNVQSSCQLTAVKVWSIAGELLLEQMGNRKAIDVSSLPQGVYMVEIVADKHTSFQRFLKN